MTVPFSVSVTVIVTHLYNLDTLRGASEAGRWGEATRRDDAGTTRLLEFGRYAAEGRKRNGRGKPESFDFLGFTHICGKTRKGRFAVLRRTSRKRLRRKLGEIKIKLRRRLHTPVPEVGKWLGTVLRGHFNYYGVPHNCAALNTFRYLVSWLWLRTLRRRSQKTRLTWERMRRLVVRYLPIPRITHPYPSVRFRLSTF